MFDAGYTYSNREKAKYVNTESKYRFSEWVGRVARRYLIVMVSCQVIDR